MRRLAVMRTLSLKTYSKQYLYRLHGSLKLKEMAAEVNQSNHRLFAPLLAYAYLTGTNRSYFDGLCQSFLQKMDADNIPATDEGVLEFFNSSGNEELVKYCLTFKGTNMRKDENDAKNACRKALLKLKQQKGLTEYRLCRLASANPGNFYAFLHQNDNSKLSLKKCNEAVQKAFELPDAGVK